MTIHEADQHQTVQAHVVEEILPHDITEVVGDVKDVINQFLPNRKRKPRAKKPTNGKDFSKIASVILTAFSFSS